MSPVATLLVLWLAFAIWGGWSALLFGEWIEGLP